MKQDHPPIHGHGKAPHDHSHKMHHEHVKQHATGFAHHSEMFKPHAAGMQYEQEKVRKMCGGGMAKK
jgi:hypothetical protein